MIKFHYTESLEVLLEILPALAWIVSGKFAFEQVEANDPNRWTIDLNGNNWWARLEDDILTIDYRYASNGPNCPERALYLLLRRIWREYLFAILGSGSVSN